ncbi:MAG: SDR family NAD(P)-dependent oxidoreductase [Paludisphaera borealis]|uniref:SDR family NAD(P)-dependent oxidoreductase n=1 Tax=Paludisphaera borealis TaxID=1387353 RepID=UPI00284DE8E9|nr:SDR family NAD(P)-dependent oxidoreductase [Paludisphaera borealis]MDR3620177.1 SDR family NAD(P)-dependent oxidoreductase [Paludisphaera borealis]
MTDASSARPRGRTILITGASAGLGAALARAIVDQCKAAALVLVARRADRLDALAADLKKLAPRLEVLTIAADLSEPVACERVARETIDRFGGVDVLINNAGLGLPTLFADAPVEDIEQQVAVNFLAPLVLTRHLIASLIARRGTIINIGSAITCVASSALGAYGATKAGLAYWNDALRRELASLGVTVCLVEPGPIRTDFSQAMQSRVVPGSKAHPVVETPSSWMTADVDDVARRVVGLIDHPQRRLSVRRRLVWPFRALGVLARMFPALGDWVVARIFHVDHAQASSTEASV